VIHDIVENKAPDTFDVQRVLPKYQRRNRSMQRAFAAVYLVHRLA
jgi:hypothetical protein